MFLLIAAVALWGTAHSLLASQAAKRFFRHTFGEMPARLYRIAYNILSVITFAPILVLMRSLPDRTLYAVQAPWLYVILVGQGLAALGLLAAVLKTDALALIGLRQVAGEDKRSVFVTDGLYRYVRHPMYLFGLLVLWLTPVMTINILILYAALTVYVLVGAYFEETKLLAEFGEAYAEYRSHTPMIVPLRFVRSRHVHMGA
jgi:protein-S-isoprenylcysteine O-methyltransferase Ste14